jgi:hypothetical protein
VPGSAAEVELDVVGLLVVVDELAAGFGWGLARCVVVVLVAVAPQAAQARAASRMPSSRQREWTAERGRSIRRGNPSGGAILDAGRVPRLSVGSFLQPVVQRRQRL